MCKYANSESYVVSHIDEKSKYKTASIYSSYFLRSSLNCELSFSLNIDTYFSYSSLEVYIETLNGANRYRREYYFSTMDRWGQFKLRIGAFYEPFRVRLICNHQADDSSPGATTCKIDKLKFHNCDAMNNTFEFCNQSDSTVCQTSSSDLCLRDVKCDYNPDCPDGEDEHDCDLPSPLDGYRCDFTEINGTICKNWETHDEFNQNPNEMKEKQKLFKLAKASESSMIFTPPRLDYGEFLLYSAYRYQEKDYSLHESSLISPILPPTNPAAYRKTSKFYGTCTIRFRICRKVELSRWYISVRKAGGFEYTDRLIIFSLINIYNIGADEYSPKYCIWHRVSLPFPRQLHPFHISIDGEWDPRRQEYQSVVALDDLSLSPNCFHQNIHNVSKIPIKYMLDSCGQTGPNPLDEKRFNQCRHDNGQTEQHILPRGEQYWTIPETSSYRMKICGASGGTDENSTGEPANCLNLIVHLFKNMKVHALVGQKGESPDIIMDNGRIINSSGAGGGGATYLYFIQNSDRDSNMTYNIIAGGGGGVAEIRGFDINNINNSFTGWGASYNSSGANSTNCGQICRILSPKSLKAINSELKDVIALEKQCPGPLILGGFGGGGNTCGKFGGGGAGLTGGRQNPDGSGQAGTSWVEDGFTIAYNHERRQDIGDGFIEIEQCTLKCPEPSNCRFRPSNFSEMYCACNDGSDADEDQDDDGIICDESEASRYFTKKSLKEEYEFDSRTPYYDELMFGYETREEAIKKLPQIDRKFLIVKESIGSGNFGEVFFGEYGGHTVAVKTLAKAAANIRTYQDSFITEALCMSTFKHDNIITLIGVSFDVKPAYLVLEFMDGSDLRLFLMEARPTAVTFLTSFEEKYPFQTNPCPFDMTVADFLKLTIDIANGCSVLEKFGYVHRDIAARNVLLTSRGPDRVAKIADFGLARGLNEANYYRVSNCRRTCFAIRWVAPEALLDGIFTTKTDIWAFGVLIWEIFCFGLTPYSSMGLDDVVTFVASGGRLEQTLSIPSNIYFLMMHCWNTSQDKRPNFSTILKILSDFMTDENILKFPIHENFIKGCCTLSYQHLAEIIQETPPSQTTTALPTPATIYTLVGDEKTYEPLYQRTPVSSCLKDLGAVSLEPYVARNPSTQKEIEERAIKLKESKENLERNPLILPNDENEAGPSMDPLSLRHCDSPPASNSSTDSEFSFSDEANDSQDKVLGSQWKNAPVLKFKCDIPLQKLKFRPRPLEPQEGRIV
ncbi:hypothetical protein WR25_04822 isoform B [Diploscapter pachys]|uniref:Protein kinase domain-containing protein n=1 Tax=Diploscapter pachys TaxID=2018661 RepID=A0A2A2J7B4_9BILA|nr:hypothetical protein WR25_04822 isoform B [Diploscapter pachys]